MKKSGHFSLAENELNIGYTHTHTLTCMLTRVSVGVELHQAKALSVTSPTVVSLKEYGQWWVN